jgi:hypothetical protein
MTTLRARLLPLFAVGAVAGAMSLPVIAGAQEYPPPTDTTVASSTTVGPSGSTVPTPTTDPGTDSNESSTLPLTGGDILGLVTIGVGALGGGYALARSGRRRARKSGS